jgi:hypothetical protein
MIGDASQITLSLTVVVCRQNPKGYRYRFISSGGSNRSVQPIEIMARAAGPNLRPPGLEGQNSIHLSYGRESFKVRREGVDHADLSIRLRNSSQTARQLPVSFPLTNRSECTTQADSDRDHARNVARPSRNTQRSRSAC